MRTEPTEKERETGRRLLALESLTFNTLAMAAMFAKELRSEQAQHEAVQALAVSLVDRLMQLYPDSSTMKQDIVATGEAFGIDVKLVDLGSIPSKGKGAYN